MGRSQQRQDQAGHRDQGGQAGDARHVSAAQVLEPRPEDDADE